MSDDSTPRITRAWLVLALLIGLILGCLGFVGWALYARVDEGDPLDRAAALRSDEPDPVVARQQLRETAEDFVIEFHSYGPEDLEGGKLTGYQDRVGALMTAKFKAAFDKQVALPEQTVSQIRAESTAEVQATGVATMDADSAEVLVGAWTQVSYQNPADKKKRIQGDKQPLRYRVMLVRTEGRWLVDDLDQVGDDLPGFAEQGGTEGGGPGEVPTQPSPSQPAAPKSEATP